MVREAPAGASSWLDMSVTRDSLGLGLGGGLSGGVLGDLGGDGVLVGHVDHGGLGVGDGLDALGQGDVGKGQDGAGGETLLALAKDVQRHPIRPGVQHVDFLLVNRNERVDVEVPVTVIGEATPGTIHMIEAATVMVSAPAVSVPETIEVDVTGIDAGTVLTIADITLPKGVEAVADAETAVVNVANEHAVASEVPEDAPAEDDDEAEVE